MIIRAPSFATALIAAAGTATPPDTTIKTTVAASVAMSTLSMIRSTVPSLRAKFVVGIFAPVHSTSPHHGIPRAVAVAPIGAASAGAVRTQASAQPSVNAVAIRPSERAATPQLSPPTYHRCDLRNGCDRHAI